MGNFLFGFFVGNSNSDSEEDGSGGGCLGLFLGIMCLIFITYIIKYVNLANSVLSGAVENKSFLTFLFYPYLIQQIHQIAGSTAIWLSLFVLIVSGIVIQILYSKQDRMKASITKAVIFKVIRLYFYLMMFYQTIYAGKLLLDSTMLKWLGWYAFGFLFIIFLRGNRVGMFNANRTSHEFQNKKADPNAISSTDVDSIKFIKNSRRFEFTQVEKEEL